MTSWRGSRRPSGSQENSQLLYRQGEKAMSAKSAEDAVFISYAWGGALAKKEWLREKIVTCFECYGLSPFWDRDTILFGQTADAVIAKALSARPIHIFCICDDDYVTSASKMNSGLYRELRMIGDMACCEDVRITPVIIDAAVKDNLPNILHDRLYVDLTAIHERGLALGHLLASVVFGATQVGMAAEIAEQLRKADLMDRAEKCFKGRPMELFGNARTHEVWINDEKLLLPPKWMYEASHWANRLADDVSGFCPQKGIWHWDHWTTSTGMRALGAAACSAFFPNRSNDEDIAVLEYCGDIIAHKIFAMTKQTEAFILKWEEVVQVLLMAEGGPDALDKLLA
jgi:hypothetical protein